MGNFDESLPYLDLALNLAREIGDREIESLCLVRLAKYNAQEKRQFAEAIRYMNEAAQIAEDAGYRQVLEQIYYPKLNFFLSLCFEFDLKFSQNFSLLFRALGSEVSYFRKRYHFHF